MSVWDYGGQAVFQTIQHLYMPRLGVYVLAFKLLDVHVESRRAEALHYLTFWLRSIDMHAAYRGAEATHQQCPPLVLIGTHLDEVEKLPDCDAVLESIDAILKENFGGKIKSFQADSDTLIPGREFLYNKEQAPLSCSQTGSAASLRRSQSLCFFPVNALDCNDANLRKLRSLLVRAITEDPLKYLEDPIPITWLRVFDKLGEAGKEAPLMKIYSADPSEPSVIALMREANALHDCSDDLSCKAQAQAMLQLFHLLGTVVRNSLALLTFLSVRIGLSLPRSY
jgi:hypothetical protein